MLDQKMKDLMKKFKQREAELIRQSKKRQEEIKKITQKKRLELINEAERRKRDLLKYNIEFQKKQEEKMKEFQRRENNRINNIYHNMRINNFNDRTSMHNSIENINSRILANILIANRIGRNINLERNEINIEPVNGMENNNIVKNVNNKIEELLQDFRLRADILPKLENKQCLICLDDYQVEEKLCYLPCFHLFHSDCIKSWVKKSNKCPLCKNIIKLD